VGQVFNLPTAPQVENLLHKTPQDQKLIGPGLKPPALDTRCRRDYDKQLGTGSTGFGT